MRYFISVIRVIAIIYEYFIRIVNKLNKQYMILDLYWPIFTKPKFRLCEGNNAGQKIIISTANYSNNHEQKTMFNVQCSMFNTQCIIC